MKNLIIFVKKMSFPACGGIPPLGGDELKNVDLSTVVKRTKAGDYLLAKRIILFTLNLIFYFGLFGGLLFVFIRTSFAASPANQSELTESLTLSRGQVTVKLSTKTGRVLEIWNEDNLYISDNYDIYDVTYDGSSVVYSDERDDVVSSFQKVNDYEVIFYCTNSKLNGLTITKQYYLYEVLSKKAQYTSSDSEIPLFTFKSEIELADFARNGGYYYQPADTGYEVIKDPAVYYPASSVSEDREISKMDSGLMVFYQPSTDMTISQYRIRRESKISGSAYWATSAGKWTRNGWQVILGSAFLGQAKPSTEIESHLSLVNGDPRAFHRSILRSPEYQTFAGNPAPDWLSNVQLDGVEAYFWQYLDPTSWFYKTLPLELPYINEGQYIVLIIQEWSGFGFYPYTGDIRYRIRGEPNTIYDGLSTPDEVKNIINNLHDLSPKIKVALYTNPANISYEYDGQWDGNIKDAHPDWLIYNSDGSPQDGEPNAYRTNIKNTEYRKILLDQYTQMMDFYGVDLIFLDYGCIDDVDWRKREVITAADCVEFLNEIAILAHEGNVAIWENGLSTSSLISDMGIFELAPSHWRSTYNNDWRGFASGAYLAKIYKEARLTAKNEVMYPGHVAYYNMVGGYGLLTQGAFPTRGFSQITGRLIYERLGNSLRDSRATTIGIQPDWWKLETNELESAVLTQGEAYILPIIPHSTNTVSIAISGEDFNFTQGNYIFEWDSHVLMPISRNVYNVPGWAEECISLDAFSLMTQLPSSLNLGSLTKDGLYHIILTQVPGFVYSMNGEREYLLLPDNGSVKITGLLPSPPPTSYSVNVSSDVATAEVLLYLPRDWARCIAKIDGIDVIYQVIEKGTDRFALLNISRGEHEIELANSRDDILNGKVLSNPTINAWKVVTDFFTPMSGSKDRYVYQRDGHNCLEIRGGDGSLELATFDLSIMNGEPVLNPAGIELWVYGRGVTDTVKVIIGSNQWYYMISTDFTGWRRFYLTRNDFAPQGTWNKVEYVTFKYTNGGSGAEQPNGILLADIRFLTDTESCTPIDEICDGLDNDCDGEIDEDDVCGITCVSTEEVCDGLDDNCDGNVDEGVKNTYYEDFDDDTYGNSTVSVQSCSAPIGYVDDNMDCDDSNVAISPAVNEVCDNNIDDNCDGNIDENCTTDPVLDTNTQSDNSTSDITSPQISDDSSTQDAVRNTQYDSTSGCGIAISRDSKTPTALIMLFIIILGLMGVRRKMGAER